MPLPNTTAERTLLFRDEYRGLEGEPIPYEIGQTDAPQKAVFTDLGQAYAAYTSFLDDPTVYDEPFIHALWPQLAANIAIPLLGTKSGADARKISLGILEEHLSAARAFNGNQQRRYPDADPESVKVRRA